MKKVLLFLTLATLSIASIFSTYAKKTVSRNRWVQVGNKWRYEVGIGSGNFVSDKFRSVFDNDGVTQKVYFFDSDGYMVTGPNVIKDVLYVFGDDGAAVTTGFYINGVHYNTALNGKVLGLPQGFDIYVYPKAKTINDSIVINSGVPTQYDDQNNVSPTSPVNSQ